MAIRFVLFDHDGTLLSTLKLRAFALELAMREVTGRDVNAEEVFALSNGQSLGSMSAMLTDGDIDLADKVVDSYRSHYYAHNKQAFKPYDGMHETLAGLATRGVRMAVVTSKLHSGAREELTGAGLMDYFGMLIGSDDVVNHKPHAEPLQKAMAAIDAIASQTLMVGDTPADVLGAKAAGVWGGAALWDTQDEPGLRALEPDHLLHHPTDVLDVVDGRI